ncbi:peptidylprolyl isomerase [Posidoniimonas polymericola]|uniref:Peptidylprolyl isomerase n=1 Tax=Posidoniimonas polymericola TaxID=2528002 RepID=A0A5C5YTX8_9BACT|nr:peptidyl-prolyl cis-trans isomerase [Posidoniimonas polymericola]TWT78462.1 peptidylprolyl isomerase [Posidoniimonas polymericola]
MPARHTTATIFCLGLLAGGLAARATNAQPYANRYQQAAPTAPAETGLQPVDECQVIAKINGELVLACELLWQTNLQIEEMKVPTEHREEATRQIMEQLLMQKLDLLLLYSDFRRSAPQADLAKIHESLVKPFEEQELPRLLKEVGVEDEQQLADRLVQLGTSLRERREDYFRVMIARSWAQEGLKFSREVTHQQLLDYYHENAAKYDFPDQTRWEELMVSFLNYPTKADAYRRMAELGNQAFQRVRAAGDATKPVFGELAKNGSNGITAAQGGVHDWTTKGALTAERVDEALFTLPPGQLSPILESGLGFHIVRVLERKQAGRTPFNAEVQSEIRDKIIDQRFAAAVGKKMRKLRDDSHVWTVFTGDLKKKVAERPNSGQAR